MNVKIWRLFLSGRATARPPPKIRHCEEITLVLLFSINLFYRALFLYCTFTLAQPVALTTCATHRQAAASDKTA